MEWRSKEDEEGKQTIAWMELNSPTTSLRKEERNSDLTLYRGVGMGPMTNTLGRLKTWVFGPQTGLTKKRKTLLIKSNFQKANILRGLETLKIVSTFTFDVFRNCL